MSEPNAHEREKGGARAMGSVVLVPLRAVIEASGDPEDRPAGHPCFGCGAEVNGDPLLPVRWPDAALTIEHLCARCAPTYRQPVIPSCPICGGVWAAHDADTRYRHGRDTNELVEAARAR